MLRPNIGSLELKDHGKDTILIKGLSVEVPGSAEELIAVIDKGFESRTTRCTDMNAASSRSHAVCYVHVVKGTVTETRQTIAMCDLAGAERASLGRRNVRGGVATRSSRAAALAVAPTNKPPTPPTSSCAPRHDLPCWPKLQQQQRGAPLPSPPVCGRNSGKTSAARRSADGPDPSTRSRFAHTAAASPTLAATDHVPRCCQDTRWGTPGPAR